MGGIVGNPALQSLVGGAMRHYAVGNVVSLVTISRTGGDPDLGVSGTETETLREMANEPLLAAIAIQSVVKSGGALKFSDLRMTVAKSDLTQAEAETEKSEFDVNGGRYAAIAMTPHELTWEFVIRKKESL